MPTLRGSSSSISASHGEGVPILLSGFTKCPGLFYTTPAQDGILSRIRIPGGILNSQQCRVIADIADECGGGYVDITNRANLQMREIRQGINTEILQRLQDLGLAANNPTVDHIRNIMTSPTAGIDPQELIDTRPFVAGWNQYILENPRLSGLSAKFSVCFDGGGRVSVSDRLNDIAFLAVLVNDIVYFRLCVSMGAKGEPPSDTGILLSPEECLPVLAALANVYLSHIDFSSSRKPRLREVLNNVGWENYLQAVWQKLPKSRDVPCNVSTSNVFTPSVYQHIGIHPQRQPGLFYIGVVLPLGRWESWQMRGLADLVEEYGCRDVTCNVSTLRLTPWQNLLITDIPQQYLGDVKSKITALGLDFSAANIKSALVACSGIRGCAASATDTKGHALILADYLETHLTLDSPVNIHFSGCVKSCAQHSQSDITLLGVNHETVEGYHVYVGNADSNQKFGRLLYQYVTFSELPALIKRMLFVYQFQRLSRDECFGEFSDRYSLPQLKQLFNINLGNLTTDACVLLQNLKSKI